MLLPVLGTLQFQRVHVFPEHPVGSSRLSRSRVIFLHSRSLGDLLVHLVVPWCVSCLLLPPALETSQGKEPQLSTVHTGPWQETVLRYLLKVRETERDRRGVCVCGGGKVYLSRLLGFSICPSMGHPWFHLISLYLTMKEVESREGK